MKLLIETLDFSEFETINEDTSSGKDLYISGPFIQTEVVNRNKRLYKKSTITGEVNRYIKERIETNRALGELNHPAHPEVNPERAAIKIVSLTESGNNFMGKAKVLKSLPMGSIVAGLISEGVRLGVSSRGLGSLKTEGNHKVVCEDFRLMTAADIVSDPSGPDCYVNSIMENKEWVWDNGRLELHEKEVKAIINSQASTIQGITGDNLIRVFEKILQIV